MSSYKDSDLIASICEGKGSRFHGHLCEFYARLTRECQLLKNHLIEQFWEQGRCAYMILQIVEEGCLKTLQELYEGLPIDDAIDYDMQAVVQRLKQQRLDSGFNLAVWHRYVHTTLYREIRKHLPFLPEKKSCGACKHLSRSSAYICMKRQEILINLSGCPDYQVKATLREAPETQECPTCEFMSRKTFFCYHLGEKRNKTDAICDAYSQQVDADFISLCEQNDLESETPHSLHPDRLYYEMSQSDSQDALSPEAELVRRDMLTRVRQALDDRLEEAEVGSKRREVLERQYEVFFALLHKLCDDVPEDDAVKTLAHEHGLYVWTVRRDIKDVRDFVKNVLNEDNFLS